MVDEISKYSMVADCGEDLIADDNREDSTIDESSK